MEKRQQNLSKYLDEPVQLELELPMPVERLGTRSVNGGMQRKSMDTGEVFDEPDYKYFSDFPG